MILNLTPHPATAAQRASGVFDPNPVDHAHLRTLLSFPTFPRIGEVHERAAHIALLAVMYADEHDARQPIARCLIGGCPEYLLSPLESALRTQGIQAVYAYHPDCMAFLPAV